MQGKRSQFKRLKLISILVLACTLQGCMSSLGTFTRDFQAGCRRVYIGSLLDLGLGWHFARDGNWAFATMSALDLPFSFALDTLVLPYTIPASIKECLEERDLVEKQHKEWDENARERVEENEKKRQKQKVMEQSTEQLKKE